MKYKIIENLLEENELKNIEDILYSNEFPWYYSKDIITGKSDSFMFFHLFMKENNITSPYFFKIILPIICKFKKEINIIYRARINCFTNQNKKIKLGQHNDHPFDHKVLLFYVNTNNGITNLNNKVNIPSIRNNLAMIDGNVPHEIVTQTDTDIRLTINITYN